MLEYDPYKIRGEFDIIHLDNNLMINFIEDLFTGYQATLLLEFHETTKTKKINLKRFEKNILSSGLLNISDLHNVKKITINYQTNPEIIFTKEINGIAIKNNKHNYFTFDNFSIKTKSNSFYSKVFLSIENNKTKVPKKYKVIHPPISLSPNNARITSFPSSFTLEIFTVPDLTMKNLSPYSSSKIIILPLG